MSLLDSLIKIAAPHSCLVCGKEGELLCGWCLNQVGTEVPARCYSCYCLSSDSAVCTKCRRKSPLKYVWVRTEYDDLTKQLVLAYKFKHARDGAPLIASLMKEALPYLNESLVVAVPTASSRVRERGFDHAVLLAKNLSKQMNLEFKPALFRLGQSEQVGQSRLQRQAQLAGAFRATQSMVNDRRILLVDDVLTTGATIEEAARTLRLAGAKTIDAAVFAQKM